MHAPLYSTITLIAEIGISAAIYYTIYRGYRDAIFSTKLAGLALIYEIVFNMSYMVSQVPHHVHAARIESPFIIVLAIVHGVLSLIMFLTLIIFFVIAWRQYRKKINFFKIQATLTTFFLIFWTFSVVSGILFYLMEYIL